MDSANGEIGDARRARINEMGGYQRLFNAIAAAVKIWPCKEAASGISISVFDFIEAFDKPDAGRQALAAREVGS